MNNQESQNPKTGLFVYGVLKGFREQQQKNSTYVNYFVGVSVGESRDDYGATTELIEELSINQEQFQFLSQGFSGLVGQPVRIPFRISLRKGQTDKGKAWAFVTQYLPQGCYIEPLNKVQPAPEKKSA